MNFLCDYVALGKTRLILRRLVNARSTLVVGCYAVLDLVLAVLIWVVATVAFILINADAFLNWVDSESLLMAFVGVVSLATTIATSIWIYAFLLGRFLTNETRRLVRILLRGTVKVIDPNDHPFKIIGIVGSASVVALTLLAFLAIAFVSS